MNPDRLPQGAATPQWHGGSLPALCWEAMREAAVPPGADADGVASEDVAACLPQLWDAIWEAARGHEPLLQPPPSADARRLLERARRVFLELVRSVSAHIEVQEVIRVLVAIERVQLAIERDCVDNATDEPAAMSVLTEVAHDIRSPLTSILFLSESLRGCRGRPLGPIEERQLMLIYGAAFEMSVMANDLTELGRSGDHLLETQPIPFSLDDVLHSVREMVLPIAEERAMDVRLIQEAWARRQGHPVALGRVLLNLVTNALRSAEEGLVEVAARPLSRSRVEFSVVDSGPGLPPDVVESLSAPFEPRTIMTPRRFSSTGLGLLICRRLLMVMGSELQARALPERGARFQFALELPPEGSAGEERGAPDIA